MTGLLHVICGLILLMLVKFALANRESAVRVLDFIFVSAICFMVILGITGNLTAEGDYAIPLSLIAGAAFFFNLFLLITGLDSISFSVKRHFGLSLLASVGLIVGGILLTILFSAI